MPKATDDATVAQVINLRARGRSYSKIAAETGLPKSTVRGIVARQENPPPVAPACVMAHADALGLDPEKISPAEAVAAIRETYSMLIEGYSRAHNSGILTDEKRLWAETQYLRGMAPVLRLMAQVSGVDNPEPTPNVVSPIVGLFDRLAETERDDLARYRELYGPLPPDDPERPSAALGDN